MAQGAQKMSQLHPSVTEIKEGLKNQKDGGMLKGQGGYRKEVPMAKVEMIWTTK